MTKRPEIIPTAKNVTSQGRVRLAELLDWGNEVLKTGPMRSAAEIEAGDGEIMEIAVTVDATVTTNVSVTSTSSVLVTTDVSVVSTFVTSVTTTVLVTKSSIT